MIFFSKDQERQLYEAMSGFPLKPGQALWLGPKSVRILAGVDQHQGGKLPDREVLEESTWRAS